MNPKRKIEVFSAGCPCCDEAVRLVQGMACPSCDVTVLDMRKDTKAQALAERYGVKRVPAVVVDGTPAECCQVGAVSAEALRSAGIGGGA